MRVSPPPVPAMVTLTTPARTPPGTEMVAMTLLPVVDAGLKVILIPVGKTTAGTASKASNVTLSVKPASRAIVTVAVALAPGLIVMLDGLTDSENAACGVALASKGINKIADANTNSLRGRRRDLSRFRDICKRFNFSISCLLYRFWRLEVTGLREGRASGRIGDGVSVTACWMDCSRAAHLRGEEAIRSRPERLTSGKIELVRDRRRRAIVALEYL